MAPRFHKVRTRVNAKTARAFHRDLVGWYRRHHRRLPWRATRDPWAIWVSEIMLQQTRVETVIPYYHRWLAAFPTVDALARAPARRVLKLWEGLGYYSRARNLHRAAQQVVQTGWAARLDTHARCSGGSVSRRFPRKKNNSALHRRRPEFLEGGAAPPSVHGLLPATAAAWQQLPGIGRYTAGAIASIAFDEREPVVDGNVARLFARVFGITANVTLPATQQKLWALAAVLLPARHCGEFNQALMELGALVCVPGEPRCAVCPLRRVCVARAAGRPASLPNRGAKRPVRRVTQDVAWIRRGDRLRLRQRPATGQLAGLWELPPRPAGAATNQRPLLVLRHAITDQRITLRVFADNRLTTCHRGQWVSRRQLAQRPMPAAHRRAVDRLWSA
jgi:A/G-specific adenine glycosylase